MNRWMRKNQKLVLYFICVFILPTFAVTGAIYAFVGFRGNMVGSFEVEPGDRLNVTGTQFQETQRRIAIWYSSSEPDIVWMHLVLLREAENAGIRVSDAEVAEFAPAFWGAKTVEEYRQVLARRRMSAANWEKTVREILMIARYQSLMMRDARVLESEVFDRYKSQNERREFEYIPYEADDFAAEFNPVDFTREELQTFWNSPQNSQIRLERRIPDKFDLKILFAGFEGFDPGAAGALAEGIEVTEDEINAVYTDPLNRDRFAEEVPEEAPEEEDADEEADEDATEEDASEEDDGSDEDDATEEPEDEEEPALKPLEEVRDAIEREIRLRKILEKVRDEAVAIQDKALADGEAARNWKEGESEGERPTVTPLDLEALGAEYGLEFATAKQLSLEELEDFTTDSGTTLPINPLGVAQNKLSSVRTADDGSAYFFLFERKIPSRDAPFDDEIEEEARDLYLKQKAFERAKEQAEEFEQTLRKATEKALEASMPEYVRNEKDEMERLEAEKKKALEEAEARAKKDAEEARKKEEEAEEELEDALFPDGADPDGADPDEAGPETEEQDPDAAAADEADASEEEQDEEEENIPEIPAITPTDEELALVTNLAGWNQLVDKYVGTAFDALVQAEGLETATLGPIKRFTPVDEEVEEETSEAKKFLMTNSLIHRLPENGVDAVVNDPERKRAYLVKVKRVELPDYSEMTPEDREQFLGSMRGQGFSQMAFSMGVYAQRIPSMAAQVLQRARLDTQLRTPTEQPRQ